MCIYLYLYLYVYRMYVHIIIFIYRFPKEISLHSPYHNNHATAYQDCMCLASLQPIDRQSANCIRAAASSHSLWDRGSWLEAVLCGKEVSAAISYLLASLVVADDCWSKAFLKKFKLKTCMAKVAGLWQYCRTSSPTKLVWVPGVLRLKASTTQKPIPKWQPLLQWSSSEMPYAVVSKSEGKHSSKWRSSEGPSSFSRLYKGMPLRAGAVASTAFQSWTPEVSACVPWGPLGTASSKHQA